MAQWSSLTRDTAPGVVAVSNASTAWSRSPAKMLRNRITGWRGPFRVTPRRQHSQSWSCAICAGLKVAPPSVDHANANDAPAKAWPACCAFTTLRLSIHAANTSSLGSSVSVTNRWLARLSLMGRGAENVAPPLVEWATMTWPL